MIDHPKMLEIIVKLTNNKLQQQNILFLILKYIVKIDKISKKIFKIIINGVLNSKFDLLCTTNGNNKLNI